MMSSYQFKILTTIDEEKWDNDLTKVNYSTFFQTSHYLNSNSKEYFPVFVYIVDHNNTVVGQLGLRIIKTVVRYSSPTFRRLMHSISSITSRGIWLDGPVIHTSDKNTKLEILQIMMKAIKIVSDKYDLVHIEGYTPGYDLLIDDDYKKILITNNFIVQENYVTFILDMNKPIDDIWSKLPKRLKQDINRARRRNISVKEVDNHDDLDQYLILAQEWARTKGIVNSTPMEERDSLWSSYKKGIEKFFLAYQDNKLISGLRVVFFNGIVQPNEVISSYSKPTSLGGTLLTWTSIEWAKSMNAVAYDFTGGKKEKPQNNFVDVKEENTKNSLLYYKSKWGGQECSQYNLIIVRKSLTYKIYLVLFKIVLKYHNFRMRQNRPKTKKDILQESTTEIKDT